uniref:Uncharacterized protein n=2 Tax=Parascaris univalens TaxID=6257 RepID=A0A915ARI8_PARUN
MALGFVVAYNISIIELSLRCALCLSSLTISTICVFYVFKAAVTPTKAPKQFNNSQDCMRVPTSDIADASRKAPSFRSRSPSIRPVFKDMRSYELDVQHIVRGLLKRAREERDDPKFADRHEPSTEECPDLFTATSVESELQSEENFEREIDIDPENASTSVEKTDDKMENIGDRLSSYSLTVHRSTSGQCYPSACAVESVYLLPLIENEMELHPEERIANCRNKNKEFTYRQ